MYRFLLLALLSCAVSASAQDDDRRTVVVEGAAEIEVPPDIVTPVVKVSTERRNQAETSREHEQEVVVPQSRRSRVAAAYSASDQTVGARVVVEYDLITEEG